MNREERIRAAEETVRICDAGRYPSPRGVKIELTESIRSAIRGTRVLAPLTVTELERSPRPIATSFEVANETTFQALTRLATPAFGHLACLNFASARHPGGGFLSGAQAQEESLARASALYPCLQAAQEYYGRNRLHRSALYLDMVIFSPRVPFFRDDAGRLLERPILASVITAPAPNAGAVAQNEPESVGEVEPALRRRADLVLRTAVAHQVDTLVLGAWGCGVFRNDPAVVARVFGELLQKGGRFHRRFARVNFAVLDRSLDGSTFAPFVGLCASLSE